MDADHGERTGDEKKLAPSDGANRSETDHYAEAAPVGEPGTGEAHPPATDEAAAPAPAADVPGPAGGRQGAGMAGLPLPYQVVAALALSVIALLACGHIAMVFLHVAPSNTLTKKHGEVVDDWVYPEFEQNWKLFAPNPLQQNISVHVRAELADDGADGSGVTRWINLSRDDGEAIRGNPLPSHVDQNELRRAWDFFTGSHDSENRSTGLRGELSERYIRRIAMLRLAEYGYGGTVERIQVRSAVRSVGAPAWSDEKISTKTQYRVLPWWDVDPSDLPRAGATDPAPQAGTSPQAGKAGK
ncbi:DUF5819 family protein [Streptomyces sp. NPDC006296]|uniref:DUF5819 family protein n=1 Tax=Streptomyces sp. NPDC006296 TaxID=3156746 RepID=UPI0033B9FA5A